VAIASGTAAIPGDAPDLVTGSSAAATGDTERANAQEKAARFVERATRTLERAAGKVDDGLRSALRRAVDEVDVQAESAARTPRPLLARGIARLRNAVEHAEGLDAQVRLAISTFEYERSRVAAAEKVAAEQAAAEQAAAEQAAAEQAAAEQAAAEQAAAEQAAAEQAAAEKAAADRAAASKATTAPQDATSPAAPSAPSQSIQEVGEATLRSLPGNGGVSLSWDDPGLSGHLGGVWKGNTSTILVNASRLAGQPSKTKDVIRHEMAHIYQGRLMAAHGMSWSQIDGLLAAAYGSNASEKVADCVAIRFGASWVNYTSDCSGADKQAWVDAFIGGYLP
jgi:chemotaxis protein histidine kinase CheA